MKISLGQYDGRRNVIGKKVEYSRTLSGNFNESFRMMRTKLTVDTSAIHLNLIWRTFNYIKLEIDQAGSNIIGTYYYFIEDYEFPANGLVVFDLRLDVLETYRESILNLRVLLERSTEEGISQVTKDTIDNNLPLSADKKYQEILFPNEFVDTEDAGTYILVTSQNFYHTGN